MPPKFIFVRHGEAEHNVAFHEHGNSVFTDPKFRDADLTPKGIQQAKELGAKLADMRVMSIWSSPLTRCIKTAEELYEEIHSCGSSGILFLHDSLLERLGGGHECNEREATYKIRKKFPCWDTKWLPQLGPVWLSRENQTSLYSRMLSFVMFLNYIYRDLEPDSHVLIVSHGDAIGSLIGKTLKNCEHVILSLEEILDLNNANSQRTEDDDFDRPETP
jgi:broad specificity phosphatase PhoE